MLRKQLESQTWPDELGWWHLRHKTSKNCTCNLEKENFISRSWIGKGYEAGEHALEVALG